MGLRVLPDKHMSAVAFCLLARSGLHALLDLREGSTAFCLLATEGPLVLLALRVRRLSAQAGGISLAGDKHAV